MSEVELEKAQGSVGGAADDLAVLKSATNFLGLLSQTHEEVKSDHILVLADKWLAWVEQSEDEEVVDAEFTRE